MYSGEYDVCDVTLSVYPHRASPTVARHIFQACPGWIYTQSNITNIILYYIRNNKSVNSQYFLILEYTHAIFKTQFNYIGALHHDSSN